MRNSPRTRKLEQILCDSTHLPGAGTFHVHALARGQPPGPYSCMHYTLHAPRAHGHASCVIRSVGCPAILSVQSDQKSMCALGAGPHDPPLPRVGISPQVLPRPSVIPTMPTCLGDCMHRGPVTRARSPSRSPCHSTRDPGAGRCSHAARALPPLCVAALTWRSTGPSSCPPQRGPPGGTPPYRAPAACGTPPSPSYPSSSHPSAASRCRCGSS